MIILKILLIIITLPLRAAGMVLAALLKILGKFVTVVAAVLSFITTLIGAIGILATLAVITMHICGQIDFDGFWLSMGSGLFGSVIFILIGQLREAIGDVIDFLGSELFGLTVTGF